MNLSKKLTDQAITLLETAVVYALAKARERGETYLSGSDINKAIGTYSKWKWSNIHTMILYRLEAEGRAESLRSDSGKLRIGWRLTDAEWDRLKRL